MNWGRMQGCGNYEDNEGQGPADSGSRPVAVEG